MSGGDLLAAMDRMMPGPMSSESELLSARAQVRELLSDLAHIIIRRNQIDEEAHEYSEKLERLTKAVEHARSLLTKYLSDHEDELREVRIYDNACRIVDSLDAAVIEARGEESQPATQQGEE